jgi:hypothetical protein
MIDDQCNIWIRLCFRGLSLEEMELNVEDFTLIIYQIPVAALWRLFGTQP